MKIITLCTLFFIFNLTFSQNWEQVIENLGFIPRAIYNDTIDNCLYIGGAMNNFDGTPINKVLRWNAITIDTLAKDTVNTGAVLEIIRYKNSIYALGVFNRINNQLIEYFARWDGNQWNSLPPGPNCGYSAYIFKDTLYIGGGFDSVNTVLSPGVASWDGNTWRGVGSGILTPFSPFGTKIYSIINYNNKCYAGGRFDMSIEGYRSIAWFDGTNWLKLPLWYDGGFVGINIMIVYKDMLYIAGEFYKSQGAMGNNILAWNDTIWSDVGGGLDEKIFDMAIYNNELYVVGCFTHAGGVPSQYIAKWNGVSWCNVGTSQFDNVITDIEIYNNEIYILGGFKKIDNDSIRYMAKWAGNSYVDTCSQTYSVTEISDNTGVAVFPNPAHSQITIISNNGEQLKHAKIYSLTGKMVLRKEFNAANVEIDVSGLAYGLYVVKVQTASEVLYKKIIIQK